MIGASSNDAAIEALLSRVAAAPMSALLLDFDGTLAPFRVNPAEVRPWAGVRELLEEIQRTCRTRIAVVTGRSACETALLLGVHPQPEIWGLHGAERLREDGRLEPATLEPEQRDALTAAQESVRMAGLGKGIRIERKENAIAVHWRGASRQRARAAQERVMELFRPALEVAGMQAAAFDGGVELRSGRNKGDAVRMILEEAAAGEPVAYLGDDATDEDAFGALHENGLGILVGKERRPSAAQVWLRPPEEVRAFLAAWLRALGQNSWLPGTAAASVRFTPPRMAMRMVGSALG
jgi:trehalose-phosphatase